MTGDPNVCQYDNKRHAPHTLPSGRYCAGLDRDTRINPDSWADQSARLRLERLTRELAELRQTVADLGREVGRLVSERESRRALAESLNLRG